MSLINKAIKGIAIAVVLTLPLITTLAQTRYIDSLKKVLRVLPADTGKAKTYIALSNKLLSSNATLSKNYADSGLALSKKLNFKDGEGNSHVRIGLAMQNLGNYEGALENYLSAMVVFKSNGNTVKQGKVYNNIGYAHMALGNYQTAIEHYLKSLELTRDNKDSSGMGASNTNIAIVFALKGDYDQAEQYFQTAINIYRKLKNEDMVVKNMLNLGGVYKDRGEYKKSIEQILVAQAYYEKKRMKDDLARCNYILGANYEALKDYKASLEQYLKAHELYKSLDNYQQLTGTKLKLGGLYMIEKNYPLALEYTDEALAMAKKSRAKALLYRSYQQLSEINLLMKKFEEAYEYRVKYEKTKDSVLNEESVNKINELEAKFQNKIRKQEINELQAANTINELRIKKQSNLKLLLAGLVFFTVIICLLIFNQYRIKKKSNLELLQKNRVIEAALNEKEVLLHEIHHRVKNNLQFVWSLLNLQARHVKDKQTQETLLEGKNRIRTMSLIHQKLYKSDNIKGIDMNQFIPDLTNSLFETYQSESTSIQLETDIDPMVLDIDTAMPVGLIMNELITNAIKYAYADTENAILKIDLKNMDNHLLLTVKDNGKGFEEGTDNALNESFGLKLVHSLAKQLKADVLINSNKGMGIEVKITKFQFA